MKVFRDQKRGDGSVYAEQVPAAPARRALVFGSQRAGDAAIYDDQVYTAAAPAGRVRVFGDQRLGGAAIFADQVSGPVAAVQLPGEDCSQANTSATGAVVVVVGALLGANVTQENAGSIGQVYVPVPLGGSNSAQPNDGSTGEVGGPLTITELTTHQRLISYIHAAVFSKAPVDQLLFRLHHPRGVSWRVADGVMTVRAESITQSFDLSDLTVQQLATALVESGYVVSDLAPGLARASALVLVEAAGSDGVSNGDRITGYTSLLWVLQGGYAQMVRAAREQIIQALRQMVITQAEGEWLDLWGRLYAVARGKDEDDAAFAPRIKKDAFRLRQSPIAIEEAVKDATGKTIRIEEPWQSVFRLDSSRLSGGDSFQDGKRVGAFLLQPTSPRPIDWTDVLPVIERNRAAGIVVLPPFSRNITHTDAGLDAIVESSRLSVRVVADRYEDRTFLDYSKIEDTPILNHPILRTQERLHRSSSSALGWLDAPWPNQPWVDTPYFVETYNYRSYRLYTAAIRYEDQFWLDEVWQDLTWNEFNTRVHTAHTRTAS